MLSGQPLRKSRMLITYQLPNTEPRKFIHFQRAATKVLPEHPVPGASRSTIAQSKLSDSRLRPAAPPGSSPASAQQLRVVPSPTPRPGRPPRTCSKLRDALGSPFDARGKLSGESFPRLLMAGHLRLENRLLRVEWCPERAAEVLRVCRGHEGESKGSRFGDE